MECVEDKVRWDRLIQKAELTDFYFSYDYHQICREQTDEAVLLHYRKGGSGILMPLLLRNIPGTAFRDATSVYGYAGPLWYGDLTESLILGFQKSLKYICDQFRIVSIFSRLHPLIPQQLQILGSLGTIPALGMIVNIDLTLAPDKQWSEVSRRYRTYINKARRTYHVYKAKSEKDLRDFVGLYLDTMIRVEAEERFFFEYEYFEKLWTNAHFSTTILMAACPDQKKAISGSMFISCGNIIQYHLSGTDEAYLNPHPLKLLIDEMRKLGSAEGMKYFNLGGGLGGQRDSLFNFKSKFSNDYKEFNVWKFVADTKIYEELARVHNREECLKDPQKCENYFPCYRYEIS